ncbi:MAG: LemA family protein [Desulfobacterales bacterium]
MEPIIMLVIFILLVSIAWFINAYNRFVKYKNRIEEAWSGIDVALRRRFNLIPNLIRAIERYEEHETKIFQTKNDYLAGSTGISNRVEEESQISKSLRGILALAEAYPDLKASTNFLELQNSLNEIEEDIQKARNRYNSNVGRFNTLIESFPAKFIARKFGFEKQHYFTLDLATQRELPEVGFSASRDSKK